MADQPSALLIYGDRQDGVYLLREAGYQLLEATDQRDLVMKWNTRSLIPSLDAYPITKGLSPKELKPVRGRAALLYGDLPAAWSTWAHDQGVSVVEVGIGQSAALQMLADLGFTSAAAAYVSSLYPGSKQALLLAARPLLFGGTPVTLQDAQEGLPPPGVVHSVPMVKLLRSIGSEEGLGLVAGLPETECWGPLTVLNRNCQSSGKRVQLIGNLLQGIVDRLWSPKVALFLYMYLAWAETKWPLTSPSRVTSPSSATLLRCRLYGIESLVPW